jgi:hypothetical protein
VGRKGLKRKSFFAAGRQKRLERKAWFAAFYGLVAILQSKIAARPCNLPQMRQNSESE